MFVFFFFFFYCLVYVCSTFNYSSFFIYYCCLLFGSDVCSVHNNAATRLSVIDLVNNEARYCATWNVSFSLAPGSLSQSRRLVAAMPSSLQWSISLARSGMLFGSVFCVRGGWSTRCFLFARRAIVCDAQCIVFSRDRPFLSTLSRSTRCACFFFSCASLSSFFCSRFCDHRPCARRKDWKLLLIFWVPHLLYRTAFVQLLWRGVVSCAFLFMRESDAASENVCVRCCKQRKTNCLIGKQL